MNRCVGVFKAEGKRSGCKKRNKEINLSVIFPSDVETTEGVAEK